MIVRAHKTVKVAGGRGGWVTVSTADVDRDGDIIDVAGWELDNWQRAGAPLLWGHDYKSPHAIIGTADARITPSALQIKPQWREPVGETDPMNVIAALWRDKLANSFSVGFRGLDWSELPTGSRHYHRQELLEISLVTIPAQPAAVRRHLSCKSLQRGLVERRALLSLLQGIGRLSEWELEQLSAPLCELFGAYRGRIERAEVYWR